MNQSEPQKSKQTPPQLDRGWERYRWPLLIAAILISLLIHISSFHTLGLFKHSNTLGPEKAPRNAVKVRLVEKPKKTDKKSDQKDAKRIIETPQAPTSPPKDPTFLGNVDHKAEKNTRTALKTSVDRAKDPGPKGVQKAKNEKQPEKNMVQAPSPELVKKPPTKSFPLNVKDGSVAIQPHSKKKPRNMYEFLLPSQSTDLLGQVNAGYQEHLDEDIPLGDRVDINTSEYRYIGYFTAMRKAIELVWIYPQEATRRGLQGEVSLEFAINKDGRTSQIRVLKSSGYDVLDRAIVDAIKLASPFAPLPEGFKKNKLVITGSFRYILGPYASH